jgi:hypothetical protein
MESYNNRVTGFAIADYAARAGRKGQAMGLCRRWTADEARARASAAGRASVAKRQPDDQRLAHARAEARRRRELRLLGEVLP